jgi:hypothetical protein
MSIRRRWIQTPIRGLPRWDPVPPCHVQSWAQAGVASGACCSYFTSLHSSLAEERQTRPPAASSCPDSTPPIMRRQTICTQAMAPARGDYADSVLATHTDAPQRTAELERHKNSQQTHVVLQNPNENQHTRSCLLSIRTVHACRKPCKDHIATKPQATFYRCFTTILLKLCQHLSSNSFTSTFHKTPNTCWQRVQTFSTSLETAVAVAEANCATAHSNHSTL